MEVYEQIYTIAEEEIPDLGGYILDKQLSKLAIPKQKIGMDDIPRITKAISEAAAMFGEKKARAIRKRIMKEVASKGEMIAGGKDPHTMVEALMDMGQSALLSGDFREAVRDMEGAKKIALENGFRNKVAEIDNRMAGILGRMKKKERALRLLEEAERISRETHTKHELGKTMYEYGSVYWWSGEPEKSLEYFEKSLEIAKELEDDRLMGYACMGMANAYSEMGDIEKDIEYSEKALLHFKRARLDNEVAKMYVNLGVPFEERGELQKAESHYLQGLMEARKTGYLLMEGWALSNLSGLYRDPMESETAEAYARSALEIFETVGDDLGRSITLMNLAKIHLMKGMVNQAMDEFEKSIEIKEKADSKYGIADAYAAYGEFLIKIADRRGKEYVRKAERMFRSIGNEKRADKCLAMLTRQQPSPS